MAQVVVQGLITEYRKTGHGETIILLHGWGDTQQTFQDLVKLLADDFCLVTVDLPGFGKTQAPETAWTLNNYASFVSEFVSKISLVPRAVIGHSNGGAIAIRALANNVISAERLVLLASSGIRGQYKGRNLALRMVAKTGKLLSKPLPKKVQNKLRSGLYKSVGSDMLVAEHLQETFKNIVNADVRPDTKKVNAKVLLIYGDQDTATPVKYAELLLEGFSDARLHVLPEAGHFVHHDEPVKVVRLIKDFLK